MYRILFYIAATWYSFIHSVFCFTTGPKPLPKPAFHILRSSASSFKWQYPLLSLRSSSSFLTPSSSSCHFHLSLHLSYHLIHCQQNKLGSERVKHYLLAFTAIPPNKPAICLRNYLNFLPLHPMNDTEACYDSKVISWIVSPSPCSFTTDSILTLLWYHEKSYANSTMESIWPHCKKFHNTSCVSFWLFYT